MSLVSNYFMYESDLVLSIYEKDGKTSLIFILRIREFWPFSCAVWTLYKHTHICMCVCVYV